MNRPISLSSVLKSDLPASIVVFFVALPLCLGIALASGAPLISGVIAGVIGGIVVASFSGSPLGVSGPAAGLAVIVLHAIEDLGSFELFLVAVVLAGMMQIALGFARAGVIAYYFPSSVITGMLSGIGIVIFLKQLPHAVGFDRDPEGDLEFFQTDGENTITEILSVFDAISPGPLLIAAGALAILIAWEQPWLKRNTLLSRMPAPLLAVLLGVALNAIFGSNGQFSLSSEQLVSLPVAQEISDLADNFSFPDFSGLSNGAVYKTAIVLAVVGSLETLLCVEATDKLDPQKRVTPTNRELKAQGIGNIVSGLVGGLPITQVIVRSSANIQAGAQSKVSAILHGVFLILSVILLPVVMNLIPLAALAAILLLVGYKLAKPTIFKKMFTEGFDQFAPFLVTVIGIVFIDLLVGVGLGLTVSIMILLVENYKLPFQVEHMEHEQGKVIQITLAQNVSFLNKASLLRTLSLIPDGSMVEIDGTAAVHVHFDVIEIIQDFLISAKSRDIVVRVSGLDAHQKGRPLDCTNVRFSSLPVPATAQEQS